MKHLIIVGIAVLLIFVSYSGCFESEVSRSSANNVSMFECVTEGEIIRFYFVLEDENGQNTICDGNVEFQIIDELNDVIYSNEFNVKSSEFIDYEYKLTGSPIGKAYEWRVSIADIEKGISLLGFGTAILTFINSKGGTISAEYELVQIPTYSEEELNDILEEEYINDSTTVNKKLSKGDFEVTAVRVGFFRKYDWGEMKKYFRVDMIVKNIGSEQQYFDPSGVAIIDPNNNQYESSYEGTLEIVMIYPGVEKSGYFLFNDVPETLQHLNLVFEAGYDDNWDPYLFEYDINLR